MKQAFTTPKFDRRFYSLNRLRGASRAGQQSLASIGMEQGVVGATLAGITRLGSDLADQLEKDENEKAARTGTRLGTVAGQENFRAGRPLQFREGDDVGTTAFNQALEASYLSELDLNIDDNMGRLARAFPTSPSSFDDAFENEIRTKLLPMVDADMRPALSMELDRRKRKALEGIFSAYEQQTAAETNASLIRAMDIYGGQNASAWRHGDLETASETDMKFRGVLDSRTDLTPQQKEKALLDFEAEGRRQTILAAFDEAQGQGLPAAEAFIKEFRKGRHKDIDPDVVESLAGEMTQSLNLARADAKAMAKQAQEQISRVVTVLEQGHPVGDALEKAERLLGSVMDPDVAQELNRAKDLFRLQKTFRGMTPVTLAAQVRAMDQDISGARKVTPEMLQTRDLAAKMLDNMERGLKDDPLEYANRVGVVSLPALDLENPASLTGRVEAAARVSEFYGRPALPFTGQEMDSMAAGYAEADATQRLAFLERLGAFDMPADMERRVLDRIAGKAPALGLAVEMVRRDPMTARGILLGQDLIKSGATNRPKAADVQDHFNAYVQDAFRADQTGASRRAAQEATLALYMHMSQGDNSAEFDPDRFNEAAAKVIGTVAEREGQHFVLPPGVTESQFDDRMDALAEADLHPERLQFEETSSGPHRLTRDGLEPIGAEEVRDDGVLVSVGPGQYMVGFEREGGMRFAVRADGKPYVLDYGALPSPNPAAPPKSAGSAAASDELAMGNARALFLAARRYGRTLKEKFQSLIPRSTADEAKRQFRSSAAQISASAAARTLEHLFNEESRRRLDAGKRGPASKVTFSQDDLVPNGTDQDAIEALAQAVWNNDVDFRQRVAEIRFGTFDDEWVDRVKAATGQDLSGLVDAIDTGQIQKAFKSHGPWGETAEDQEPVSPEALSIYRGVVRHFDSVSVRRHKNGDTFLFEKRINGVVAVIQQRRTAQGTLAFFNMWMKKP
jgi:hypothetical protein